MKTQTVVRTKDLARTGGRTDEQLMRVGFAAIGISALVAGIWAFASLVGGMAASGGPLSLAAEWLRAITG